MQRVVVVGAGPHAQEVMDIFEALNEVAPRYEILGFVVDSRYGAPGTMVGGFPIVGDFRWLEKKAKNLLGICGVGRPELRCSLARRAQRAGLRFCSVVHPSTNLTGSVHLGQGVVIAAGCQLTRGIHIGHHVHINIGCSVSHDVRLGNYAYLAPGVHVAGRVSVGTGAYVGIGASVISDRGIGDWSVVGAGAAVIHDVPSNATVVGVPARVIKTRTPGWHLSPGRPPTGERPLDGNG